VLQIVMPSNMEYWLCFLVIEFLFYMNLFVLNFCILAPGSLKLVSAFQ